MRVIALLLILVSAPALAGEVSTDPAAICPIMAGEAVPEGLTVRSADGAAVDLSALLAEPTILIVYRGGWCPYCSAHMQELHDLETDLAGLGYQLVALSPDRPGKVAEVVTKLSSSRFQVFSDSPMEVCEQFGIAFELDGDILEKYRGYGIDIEGDSGFDHHRLPVPAAMVITDSTVRFIFVNPDHRVRVDGMVLLAAARAAMVDSDNGR